MWNLSQVILIIILLSMLSSPATPHSTEEVHKPLAEKAWDKMNFSPNISDLATAKEKIKEGAVDEDAKDSWVIFPRSSNHGYNPLTLKTGGIFIGISARSRAVDLWESAKNAFNNGELYGGDESGGYHFLGRISHMIQDMSSPPHVLWGGVIASHYNYENYWGEDLGGKTRWECWWNDYGNNQTRGPLKPTDLLPSFSKLNLDLYSIERLNYRWNQVKANGIGGYIDTLSWITYFRTTIWGEITADQSHPAPTHTTPTLGLEPKPNALLTMFGSENIYFTIVDMRGYHYWTIVDKYGYFHYYGASFVIDDWWPTEGPFPDGHYEEIDKSRYTGRFYFSSPAPWSGWTEIAGYQSWIGIWPRNWPDGSSANGNLAWYFGKFLFPLTIQYNAGFLGLAHPEVTINILPSGRNLTFKADGVNYTNNNNFRWPIKSPHEIEVPSFQIGSDGLTYIFSHWSDGGDRVHEIYPEHTGRYTAYYTVSY